MNEEILKTLNNEIIIKFIRILDHLLFALGTDVNYLRLQNDYLDGLQSYSTQMKDEQSKDR